MIDKGPHQGYLARLVSLVRAAALSLFALSCPAAAQTCQMPTGPGAAEAERRGDLPSAAQIDDGCQLDHRFAEGREIRIDVRTEGLLDQQKILADVESIFARFGLNLIRAGRIRDGQRAFYLEIAVHKTPAEQEDVVAIVSTLGTGDQERTVAAPRAQRGGLPIEDVYDKIAKTVEDAFCGFSSRASQLP